MPGQIRPADTCDKRPHAPSQGGSLITICPHPVWSACNQSGTCGKSRRPVSIRGAGSPATEPRLPTGRSAKRPCCSRRSYSTSAPATARLSAKRVGIRTMWRQRRSISATGLNVRPEHIGRIQGMAERRKVGRGRPAVRRRPARSAAAAQRPDVGEAPQRHMRGRVGGVGEAARARIPAGADDEAERGAEGVRGAQQGADIGRLRHPLDADAEIAARSGFSHGGGLCRAHDRRNRCQAAAQYETYPYPRRDPRDEAKRLIVGSPGHLREVDHWVFGAGVQRPGHCMR